jgi:hypothetical protein
MHLYLTTANLLRQETDDEVIATLLRKGWAQIPDPEVPGSTWNGSEWEPPAPEPVRPNYQTFYEAFLNSNLYQSLLVPALLQPGSDVLGNVLTIVAVSLQDALVGRVPLPDPNTQPNSLQSAIWLLMSVMASMLSAENLAELQGLLDAHGLSTYYTLTPPQQ